MQRNVLLRGLPTALVGVTDLGDVLRLTAKYVTRALDYEDCVIYLRAQDGLLEQRAAWGPKSPDGLAVIEPLRLDFGQGIVGSAAACQSTQLVFDTSSDDRYVVDKVFAGGSELAVPIVYAGETLGVIDSEHTQRSYFTHEDAAVVEAIAAMVAAMVASALSTEELNRTIDALHETQRELEQAAATDILTGVGNRRRLVAALGRAVDRGERFGVAVIDIDGLKKINDSYGTGQGDAVLQSVAQLLRRRFGGDGRVLARCEGDEFVVVAAPLPGGFAVQVNAALDDIRTLRVAHIEAGHEITASAGVAYGNRIGAWGDATDALSLAKRSGGNTLSIYRPDDPSVVSLRADRDWANRIEKALTDGSLALAVQRVATVNPERTNSFHEVLLRHRQPDGTFGSPTELLRAAERLGLEEVVDTWVMGEVLAALQHCDDDVCLSMNWSPSSITSERMVRLLLDEVAVAGVRPGRIIIEVTEHACIDSPELFHVAVERLRGAGVGVAIDDLGSGWSSLRTLQGTPVDFIKLDGQWVCGARHDELSLIAIRSMIECAKALDTTVVAEWVEDQAVYDLVTRLGVDYVQGWMIHRPEPLEAFAVRHASTKSALRV